MADQQFEAELDPEVREFGAVVREAVRDAGGFDLVMRSESEPTLRTRAVEPLLTSLGVFDLDPGLGEEHLQAAATACRAAGAYALPYPVAERLAAAAVPRNGDSPAALGVVPACDEGRVRLNMGDLALDWNVVDTAGRMTVVVAAAAGTGGRLGPFVAELTPGGGADPAPPTALALAVHLQSFTLLGMLESALELTVAHARDRVQFGAPIIGFQAVQHQLAQALIRIELFERQALYALWSLARERDGLLVDVAGARAAGLHAADVVLRVGHQLHGATGLCDESPISWISRHSQPLRRLPLNRAQTERWFTGLVVRGGVDGLFPSTVAGQTRETDGCGVAASVARVASFVGGPKRP